MKYLLEGLEAIDCCIEKPTSQTLMYGWSFIKTLKLLNIEFRE